jgi:hypothetical protein
MRIDPWKVISRSGVGIIGLLCVPALLLTLIFVGTRQVAFGSAIIPHSYWSNQGHCTSAYTVPGEFNLKNMSGSDYRFSYYMVGGGGGHIGITSTPAAGASTSGTFNLASGQTLRAVVGGGGGGGSASGSGSGGAGHYGGGSGGWNGTHGGGGGGGSSAILIDETLIAHAAGGAGGTGSGGGGGGGGGTQSAGGAGGTGTIWPGRAGSLGMGGHGICATSTDFVTSGYYNTGGIGTYSVGGSNGQSGTTTGALTGACSNGGGGGGGYGSGGGTGGSGTQGTGAVSWLNRFSPPAAAGTAGVASFGGGNAGLIILCRKNAQSVFVSFPNARTPSLSTVVISPTVTAYGNGTVSVSVSGAGNPQISINGGVWTTSGTLTAHQTIAIRQTSPATALATNTATLTIGSDQVTWSVTTLPQLSLGLTNVTGAGLNLLTTSNTATTSGTSGTHSIYTSGSGDGQISIGGGTWTTSGNLTTGQTIAARITSSSIFSDTKSVDIACDACGGRVGRWTVTTGTMSIPAFASVTNASVNTVYTSNIVTVTGTAASAPLTVGGTGTQISINGGAWVTSGTISPGQTLQVRFTSSASAGTTAYAYVYYGQFSTSFAVTTGSPTFTLTNITGANLSTVTTSATVTSAGVNSCAVSISGSGTPQLSIGGGAWTTSGTLTAGQTIAVRLTSSSMTNTTLSATISCGSSQTWSVSTGELIIPKIPDVTNALANNVATSSSVTASGTISATISISGSGSPQISIGGGVWTTSGTISPGQTLQLRLTYGAAGTVSTANLSISVQGSQYWSVSSSATYNPVLISGSSVLRGSTGMTQNISSSVDDGSFGITLPFGFFIDGTSYTSWFVGSNTYITAGAGSSVYSSLGPGTPALPKFMLGAADNSYQRVFTTSGTNFHRIRYEGTASTSGTVGSPTIVYETTFYRPANGVQYVQVVFGVHGRTSGQFGVANSSAWFANTTPITANSSYVFASNSSGLTWTIHPNSSVAGVLIDQ